MCEGGEVSEGGGWVVSGLRGVRGGVGSEGVSIPPTIDVGISVVEMGVILLFAALSSGLYKGSRRQSLLCI